MTEELERLGLDGLGVVGVLATLLPRLVLCKQRLHDDAPLGQELRLCAVQVRPRPVVLGVRSMRASKRSLVLQLVGLLLELGQGLIAVV